jgi:hypothetical protein
MGDTVDLAQDGIERAHAAHATHGDHTARRVAILISALAASLALAEMGEKSAQNAYLTHHISLSDNYAFYQARTVRWSLAGAEAELLESLPNAADAAVHQRADAARAEAARLNDDAKSQGRKQLLVQAKAIEAARDTAFHRYEEFEIVVGALQIAIVLASVSVVTRMLEMSWAAGAIGGCAALYGLLVAGGAV